MAQRATRQMAKKTAAKHCAGLTPSVDGEYIEIWFNSCNDEERERAETAAKAIQAELNCHIFGNMSAWFLAYKRPARVVREELEGVADPMHY